VRLGELATSSTAWKTTKEHQLVMGTPRHRARHPEPAGNQHDRSGGRHPPKLLPQFRSQIPASVKLDILYDRSISDSRSIADVKFTLCSPSALWCFGHLSVSAHVSATAIPSFAVPLAIVRNFCRDVPARYTVDNLSLMALTLSVGFVVDDAL